MTSIYSRCRIHACRRNATSGFQKTQTKPSPSPSNQNPRITSIQTYRPHFSGVKRLLPAAVPRAPIRDVTPSPCFETCGPSPFPLLGHVSLKCSPSQKWAVSLDSRKIGAGRRSQCAKKALHTLSASKPRWQPQSPRRPPLPGLPSDPVAPLQPSNSSKSLVRAAPPPRSARPAGPARRRRCRSPSSGPPALATASSCVRARSRTSIQAFRGLIAVVLSVASLHRRPMVAPEPRVRVSRSQARGKKPPPRRPPWQLTGGGERRGPANPSPIWGAGRECRGTTLRVDPPPRPPPRTPRLASLKLRALT